MTGATPPVDVDARPARLLLRHVRQGVLATHSIRSPGFPYASAVPFALDAAGRPLILISDLAAHTRDIHTDPRVSLCGHDPDVSSGRRTSLVGIAQRADDDAAARARYLALVPEAARYAALGDFHLYRIEPHAVHWIGGFGDIRWFEAGHYLLPPSAIDGRSTDILGHMNGDHADTLRDYCRHYHGIATDHATMLTVDGDGFDVHVDNDRVLRIDFPEPALDVSHIRARLVAMARESRGP
ncbi:MAG: DUF2470 domain-containing protein [Burkholderiales bacterium]|nr:DUF2470 domain-containing protein [Burkholderiales bacterium]